MLQLVDEAVHDGARECAACSLLGISVRTVQRWRSFGPGGDRRRGPIARPANRLTVAEEEQVIETANLPEFRDLSPKQIVPALADAGRYVASESTFYRLLRRSGLRRHRAASKPPTHHRPPERVTTGANQIWSWDITYLRSAVRGEFYRLYMVMDVWSRRIVGWAVHDRESSGLAAAMIEEACGAEGVDRGSLVLHADNGGPMRGATLLATLQRLGVVPSFSRPHVSDDNPYSESLFRTLKYRPGYPRTPFRSLSAARLWVAGFVAWYNGEHLHSGLCFVTPNDRHFGRERRKLEGRAVVYAAARAAHPERWSRRVRRWEPVGKVLLNQRSGRHDSMPEPKSTETSETSDTSRASD